MLRRDVDDVCEAQPPLKRRKDEEGTLPSGPKTIAEAMKWAESTESMLRQLGQGFFNRDYAARLRETLLSGVCLRTGYSGLGGPEEALHQIVFALRLPPDVVKCQRGGDILEQCRNALCHRVGASAPQCVHGDIMDAQNRPRLILQHSSC